ncbi:squalene/phytoene synthase family protein, partial [Escherichia coli]
AGTDRTVLRRQTELALSGETTGDPPFAGLRMLRADCALPPLLIEDHLAGFARDAAGWRPQSEVDLLSYCYNVVGAVGCLMAIVMG